MRLVYTFAAALALSTAGHAATVTTFYDPGLLRFETQESQSMWGPGNAIRFEGTERLTVPIDGGTGTIGGFVGGVERVRVPNPRRVEWELCRLTVGLFGSCGRRPPATIRVRVDTRTGATFSAQSRGAIGAEVSYLFDGGSVNARVEHAARAVLPTGVRVGESFHLNPQTDWTDGSLSAQSPTAGASVGTYLDMELRVSGEACAAGRCSSANRRIIDTGVQRQEIVDIDPNRIRYLDGLLPGQTFEMGIANQEAELSVGVSGSVPIVKIEVESEDADGNRTKTELSSGFDASISTQVASASIRFPEDGGSARLSGDAVTLGLRSDFLEVKADVDALAPFVPPGGFDIDLGPFSLSIEGYDIDVGPKLDVFQNLTLKSDLFVDLVFDKQVEVEGEGLVERWSGFWKDLPGMKVFERTVFSPVYSVVSQLYNRSGLALGFELTAELFKIGASASIGQLNLFDEQIGPLVKRTIPLAEDFRTVNFFNGSFRLGGFNTIAGPSFVIDPVTGPGVGPELTPVPLPAGVLLLLTGLGAMAALRRRAFA